MAKIGVFKPFRGSYSSLSNIVLEDGEIAFTTDNKRIYMGDGTNDISSLIPFINNGNTDISSIGDGSITGAINTINSKIVVDEYVSGTLYLHKIGSIVFMTCYGWLNIISSDVYIPSSFRPKVDMWSLVYRASSSTRALMCIDKAGKIDLFDTYPTKINDGILVSISWYTE